MLRERILKTLNKREDLNQRKLSRIAGVNEPTMSRYLRGYEVLNLGAIIKIVQYLYPEEEKEIMAEYVLTEKSRNARHALEYCALNWLFEQLELLIEMLAGSVNPVDKEWAQMYQFILLRQNKILSPEELLERIELFNPKEVEMKTMKEVLRSYIYFDLNDYSSLILHTNKVELLINKVKSAFMKDCLNIRFGFLLNNVYMHKNEVKKARHYISFALNQNFLEYMKAVAYNNLGHSYIFEDYAKSIEYLSVARELFIKLNSVNSLSIIERNLLFVRSYWGVDHGFDLKLKGWGENQSYAYYLIKKGELTQAKLVLESIDLDEIPNVYKGFQFYYLGLIDQKIATFYKSVKWFHQSRNLFYIQLPIQELIRLGEDQDVLSVWTH